ncbi:hypothetical protein, partial [Stenotrophomonas sp. GbtcB23]|uniref:hypothetical protein n=1 Tax=Stenotrophomonas sp. GbtcB23 TaxID=2824768 RepID=UPI001C2F7C27
AAGYVLAGRSDWAGASEAWSRAATAPATSEYAALELARVKRMLGASNAEIRALAGQSSLLTNMLAIDSEEAVSSPYAAYLMLGEAQYEVALKLAQPYADMLPRMIRMVAASDGASSEYADQALAMTADQGIDPDPVWATW